MMRVRQAVDLMQAFAVDEGHLPSLPPLPLALVAYDDLPELDRARIRKRLREHQKQLNAEAVRQGRDPLAEAIAVHLAACAITGLPPLVEVSA